MKTIHAMMVLAIGWAALAGPALGQAVEKAAIDSAKAKPAVSPEKAKQAEADFEAGRALFFQGDYKAAIGKLSAAVVGDPGKSSYKLMLAKAHQYGGEPSRAAGLLDEILKDNPEHVEAGVELGRILAAEKKFDRVISTLEPLLKFKHDYPIYHMLAQAYYQKENMAKAREYFEEAVKLNPASGGDWYELANIYLAESRFAKSADAYEKAHELGVESAVLHFKLASVYFNLRNYLGRVTTAEVIGGQAGQIKNNLLLIDPVAGRKDTFYVAPSRSAIFQVRLAQEMGIDLPQIRFLEANIWLSARRYAKAEPIYKALEGKLEKGDQGLYWFYRAQAALGLDDYDGYLARLGKAIEAAPDVYKAALPDAYVTVARRYQQRGDNARYIEFLGKAVGANPLSAGLHLTLADALWQLARRPEAAAQYRLVMELEPDHADRVRLLNRIREVEGAPPSTTQPETSAARKT